ncbi:uncharacterized protein ARMOST_03275 [Armillaria ostoyae]|uniref:Uncharacterized protein n=1 Tax=Armillaria ostoyae TaxID=47428 RepID=A0A284QU03_ARMOS|nr:uncharacterized protein ARMOST_03275 [Armillaria ostoyae]
MELPPELVDLIIAEFWYSELPSKDRITFMTACPLINSTWRDVYARITSRDIYVPTVAYLLYLAYIIRWKHWPNNSAVYGGFPPDSTRSITCYVDLTNSKDDAAKDPYSAFCNMPNYIGFRRCFPNIEKINLEMKFCVGWYWNESFSRQLFRTQVSIKLGQAMSELSVLPVEWSIAVHCPPDVEKVCPITAQIFRRPILEGITMDMVQRCHTILISPAEDGSTYHHGAHHFRDQFCIDEKRGDVRSINFHTGRVTHRRSRSWSESPLLWSQVCCLNQYLQAFKDILSEIYGAAKFGYIVAGQVEIERRSWDHVLTQAAQ